MRELSLHVLDLLENALAAGATMIRLTVDEDRRANRLMFCIADDGRGMDAETQAKALDPFFTTRTTRHVGLGLPLFKAAAERCGGDLVLHSRPGEGTTVAAWFELDHIDRAPLGDMVGTLMSGLMSERAGWDLEFTHCVDGEELRLSTTEIREVLGDVPLTHPEVREWLETYLRQGYAELPGYGERSPRAK